MVVLVTGVMGACRKNELYYLNVSNIKDLGTAFLMSIPNTKSRKPKEFTVTGEICNIIKKYYHSRPRDILSDNFVNFQRGKCTKQVIGINNIGNMPKLIATFLNLKKLQEYTDLCYRITSATVLLDAGADLDTLKRYGGWKSSQVAERYIENSVQYRINIGNKLVSSITGSNNPLIMPSTSNYVNVSSSSTTHAIVENSSNNAPVFYFENCTNITINTK